MALFLGKAHLQGIPATITFYDTAGASLGVAFTQPNFKRLSFTHGADYRKINDPNGNFDSAVVNNEFIEVQFDFIWEGASQAGAKTSATNPPVGATADTVGLPVVILGTFADGLNANGTNFPWIYEGGGAGDQPDEGDGTGRITLRRYKTKQNRSTFLATS